ncbi:hypothetical protein V3C99_011684 [Haemonchus contortus]
MSKVEDVLVEVDDAKHRFAGHLMRREDGRWSSATIRWADPLAYRNNVYDPESFRVTTHWVTRAQDREQWKRTWDPRKANRRADGRVVYVSK